MAAALKPTLRQLNTATGLILGNTTIPPQGTHASDIMVTLSHDYGPDVIPDTTASSSIGYRKRLLALLVSSLIGWLALRARLISEPGK